MTRDPSLQIHGRDVGDEDYEAVWDLEEECVKAGIAKTLDDERTKVADCAVDNLCGHAEQEDEPRLGIENGLPDLVPLDLAVLNACLVLAETLDGNSLLGGTKPTSSEHVNVSFSL